MSCTIRTISGKGTKLDAVHIVDLLKCSGNQKDLARGSWLHNYIQEHKLLEKNLFVANTLVSMYARCGALIKAEEVLKQLLVRDVVTWNALLAGYVQQQLWEEALKCFDRMQLDGQPPNVVTFTCALKACANVGAAAKGTQIYEKVLSLGLLRKDVLLGNAVVDMFAKCGAVAKSRQVLEELPVRNVITWTALIAGYAQQGKGEEALKCFDSMQEEGHTPDASTFTCALKACASIGTSVKGKQIYDKVVSLGMHRKDIMLGSSMVDMLASYGALTEAKKVLEELPVRDVVSWTALIAGYAQQEQGVEALECFDSMQREGHSPDTFAFTCALKACGSIGATVKGEQIHDKLVSLGMLDKNIVLGNAVVDMYARCAVVGKAQQVLEELSARDSVTWIALTAGYAQQGQGEEALKCFDCMQQEGHSLNAVTFTCALKACWSIGAAAKGKQIYDKIATLGILGKDTVLGNALVNMFAKCGALTMAQQLLEGLAVRNVVTWTTLIAGYAQHGQLEEALKCFDSMQQEGHSPDASTLICLMNACCHSGVLDRAQMFFWTMNTKYGVTPALEHYCCMVDLFGRIGKFNEALDVIEGMPSAEYLQVWVSLLAACHTWGEVKIGRLAFEHALHLDKTNATIYVFMGNIHRSASMQQAADNIELKTVSK